ncbi:MAG: ATP-binding protein [Acetatifactor sp.]|nr:ATP-binding protein [Acetatifactor sp.]
MREEIRTEALTEGFCSLEEHMQEYTEIFLMLQQGESAWPLFPERCRQLEERERRTDIFLPAVYLRECYGLTETEYWTVMFAFCCELEGGLCIDFREKYKDSWPGLQYILHLLSPVLPVSFSFVAGFYGEGSALRDILDMAGEEGGFSQRPLRLKPTVVHFLLTGELPKEGWYRLFGAGEEEGIPQGRELLPLHEKEYEKLCACLESGEALRILLWAERGCGSHVLLRRVCRKAGVNVVFVNIKALFDTHKQSSMGLRQTLCLLVRLSRPMVILESWEESPDTAEWEIRFQSLLGDLEGSCLCFLAQTPAQASLVKEYVHVRFSLTKELTGEEKRQALDCWLEAEERRPWQEEMFDRCQLNIGELKRRQQAIRFQARADGLSLGEWEAWLAGMQERQEVFSLGRLIECCCEPEEMILPKDCQRQLNTALRLARAWRGEKGLQLMFHGSSGTGKTMAASVLARQLGLPLFKVDLSQVFDKYIGETEKHVDEIFRTAGRNHYLLFFDEADALFAKRTAVRDSHDRYANVSASYLLQRMEEYNGILILATNLKDHFDDAFVRRIRFVIKFRNPDEKVREKLWRKALEGEPQVARDVDFGALAAAAALSPARICSAAHVAKLLASCDESPAVTRSHLLEALELEAGKDETTIGRI